MADKTPLRDLIALGESDGAVAPQGAASAYDVIVGLAWRFADARPPAPITSMTVAGVSAWQRAAIRAYRARTGEAEGYSAAGRYQIIRATLVSLEARGVVQWAQLFDAPAQDACCDALLDDAGFPRWAAGSIGDEAFAAGVARIWASWPVLRREQGQSRIVDPGESYYAGDARNTAHISVEQVRGALELARVAAPADAVQPRAAVSAAAARLEQLERRVAALEAGYARVGAAFAGDHT